MTKLMRRQPVWEPVIRVLYPTRCPVCDRPVKGMTGMICSSCAGSLKPITGPRCRKCSKPVDHQRQVLCRDCEGTPHVFDFGFALYPYRETAESIYRLKYAGRREYGAFYAKALIARFGSVLERLRIDAVVPVPLYKDRLQKRGYNQAEEIAAPVAARLNVPVRTDLVRRILPTKPQKELNLYERRNNLKNAFKLVENDVKLKSILLVDDIYTTGATLDAIARIFRASGVERIYFLTIAIGSLS